MTADTAEREDFEKWAYDQWQNSRPPDNAWLGWQARAALPARAPEGWVTVEAAPKGFKLAYVPDYPEGEVTGPCVCGSWPGGKCLRCLVQDGPWPPVVLSAAPPPPEQGVCPTCSGRGLIGAQVRFGDGEVDGIEEPCPDCSPPPGQKEATWFEQDVQRAAKRQEQFAAALPSGRAEPIASPAPGPAEPVVKALEAERGFVAGIQGFAAMCDSAARSGGMEPDDCNMIAVKLRDAAFVVDQLQKLRDGKIASGWELRPALTQPAPAPVAPEECAFVYRNYRGVVAERRVKPLYIWYGSTKWHPEPQWFIKAMDLDKAEQRDFALRDINPPAPAAGGEVPFWVVHCDRQHPEIFSTETQARAFAEAEGGVLETLYTTPDAELEALRERCAKAVRDILERYHVHPDFGGPGITAKAGWDAGFADAVTFATDAIRALPLREA